MNIYQLKTMAKEFAKEYWDMEFNVLVKENGRLTKSLGRMCFKRINSNKVIPTKLEIASRLLQNYSDETIIGVLKHELCHWALAVQEKPFNDGHPVFEAELQRVGASSSFTIQPAGMLYTVVCTKCGGERGRSNTQGRLRKLVHGTPRRTWSSGCCSAKMEWGPTVYIEDKNGDVDNSQSREVQKIQRRQAMSAATQTAAAIAPTPKLAKPVFKPVLVPTPTMSTNLDEVLIPGPRGVSNKQMIPAIMKAIDLRSTELLKELAEQYPDIYISSKKYLNKTYKAEYEALIS